MYFNELPKQMQNLIKNKVLETYQDNTNDAWPSTEEALSALECHSRDGFIAFSHNKGGIQARGFQDLMNIFGSGYYPTHKAARKVIEDQIEYNLNALGEDIYERFEDLFKKHKIAKEDVNYPFIQERANENSEFKEVLQAIEDGETEVLTGDENSIMYEIRFMYHGQEKGIHSASISIVINTEAPYFRSSIAWMPELKCEHGKEVEITWKTVNGLKTKLNKVLKQLAKKVL